jgi:CBS domain-containing protein
MTRAKGIEEEPMQVSEIMSQPVITAREETSLEDIARLILENNIGGVPVVRADGSISGFITESDFAAKEEPIPFSTFRAPQVLGNWLSKQGIERIYESARNRRAVEIMSVPVVTLPEDAGIEAAVELMLEHDINRIPIVRDGKPVGIIARHDLLRLIVNG